MLAGFDVIQKVREHNEEGTGHDRGNPGGSKGDEVVKHCVLRYSFIMAPCGAGVNGRYKPSLKRRSQASFI